MKILYFKGCKWLLSQKQQVRNDFFGYGQYESLANHVKPFLKSIKVKRLMLRLVLTNVSSVRAYILYMLTVL